MRRLTFVRRSGKVELLSDQPVQMKLPRPVVPQGANAPFWYELLDQDGKVLHRLAIPDPLPNDTEVFSPDPDRSIRRVDMQLPETVFSIVVPDVPGTEDIRLMRQGTRATAPSVAQTTAKGGGPIEIVRISLVPQKQGG